ncbi:MAG: PorP/SprF family type IX secretion system membrane protein [Prevotellaceae bacterium]|jgi:type IX secretion system PorP/SprF family membrane protein|nr:PorP/SprF family type IX secretion system membrane protein [Prevotellaceae bacterium]
MKKVLIVFLICFTAVCKICAQFDGQYSQYVNNLAVINPANCGAQSMMQVSILQRTQWLGFKGAPIVSMLSVDAPFKIGKSENGAGIQFLSDIFGVFNNQQVNFAYSHRFKIKGNHLAAGVNLGFVNLICNAGDKNSNNNSGKDSTNARLVHLIESEYHKINDEFIPDDKQSGIGFDLGFGVQYLAQKWRVGFSVAHLNHPKMHLGDKFVFDIKPFYMLHGGYDIATSNPNYGLRANLLVSSDLISWTFHASLIMDIKEKFWAGLGYRLGNDISFMFGMKLFEGFKIGYTFDLPTTQFIAASAGSHEFFASYEFALVREKSKAYKSIRIL